MVADAAITTLAGIGEGYGRLFCDKLNIKTVSDLLNHFPTRYEDFSKIVKIANLVTGEKVTVYGKITSASTFFAGRLKIQNFFLADNSTSVQLKLVFFNQPFLLTTLKKNTLCSVAGVIESEGRHWKMVNPEWEIIKNQQMFSPIQTGRIVPVYPETAAISSKRIRGIMSNVIKNLPQFVEEFFNEEFLCQHNLLDLFSAYREVHFPKNITTLNAANRRLAFNEFFLLQLRSLKKKKDWEKQKSQKINIKINQSLINSLISSLPFVLTKDQQTAIDEIFADFQKSAPMNRLLEGEVGSGKTVVAAISAWAAFLAGFSSAIMCPTEILANQHFATLQKIFSGRNVPIKLITSTTAKKPKMGNEIGIFVGTHALLENKVVIPNLNFVIIDEQHRFGVEQRAKLASKGFFPHILTMTATPIPRSMALTVLGNLSLSILKKLPHPKNIKTWVVEEEKRNQAYSWIMKKIRETKCQVFVVCPFIEPSETTKSVKNATEEFTRLTEVFSHFRLSLLTGKTPIKEKNQIMADFAAGHFDILVATPVVEVGLDIPKASIIIIEQAERFGLAQLHQLRGRVGRRGQEAFCLLFSEKKTSRLKKMETVDEGLILAEFDLKLRGQGDIFGFAQHGEFKLKKADYNDLLLIKETHAAAEEFLLNIDSHPVLLKLLQSSKIQNVINN